MCLSRGGYLQPAGGHPGGCGDHLELAGGRNGSLGGGEAVEWVSHQCSQDVELGISEVVEVEASRPPSPLVGGRSVPSVDILGRLQKGIDKIR